VRIQDSRGRGKKSGYPGGIQGTARIAAYNLQKSEKGEVKPIYKKNRHSFGRLGRGEEFDEGGRSHLGDEAQGKRGVKRIGKRKLANGPPYPW